MMLFAFSAGMSLAEESAPNDSKLFHTMQDVDLSDLKWIKRPVVVFADSPNDPAFIEQMDLLRDGQAELSERDVIVITDTAPDPLSDLRRKLRPRGFMLVLIGKDGGVKLRKPFPWDVREISRSIDKMPIRQREIREGKDSQ
jgi:hypothetical protein